jgi:hypothetical protein
MSLGSHICKRGRAALSASGGLSCTHREPLLFLYPQWIRTAATHAQALEAGGSKKSPPIGNNHASSTAHIPDFGSKATTGSPKYEELLEKLEKGSPTLVEERVSQANHPALNANNAMKDEAQQSLESNRTIRGSPDSAVNSIIGRNASERHFSSSPITDVIRRVLVIKGKLAARKAYNKQAREEYEEKKASERVDSEPNWRHILYSLDRHTLDGPEYWQENVLRIRVPIDAVRPLLSSEEYNIWAIERRCGCQIDVSEVHDASQRHRVLLVYGTVRSITKAAAEILRTAPGAISDEEIWSQQDSAFSAHTTRQRPGLSDDSSTVHVVRPIRTDRRQKMAAPIRADKVPRPQTWTPESFGLYVQSLTSIRMSTHLQKMLYEPGQNHTDAVVNTLQALFTDPKCMPAISVSAFNNTLAYLVKHNAIHVVRDLFVRMEMQNLRMNTETFNIMLRGAAKSQSLSNFRYILWLMLRRGYKPNADTWLVFMRAMEDPKIKAHILKGMKKKELLYDPRIQQRVCENFVEMETITSLENGMTHKQFLTHMADRYGRSWLSTHSANRILYVLGSRGLISRCVELLEFMNIKGISPNDVSIRTVLHHCEKQENPQGAVEIIRRISSLIGYKPCEDAYHSLFNIAWRARLHCVARVIWRYACLNAATTFRMRKRIAAGVHSAITSSNWSPGHSKYRPRKEWAARASRFILGLPMEFLTRQGASLPDEVDEILPHPLYGSAIQTPISELNKKFNPCEQGVNPAEESVDTAVAFARQAEGNMKLADESSTSAEEDTISAKKTGCPTGELAIRGPKGVKLAKEDTNAGDNVPKNAVIVGVLEEQLEAFKFWKPKRPFADVLVEAFEIDKVFGADHSDDRLAWLYMCAPQIPLRMKTLVPRKMPWNEAESFPRGGGVMHQREKC